MDIVRYDQLIPSILTELPGITKGVIQVSLLRIGREFFRRSGAWAVTLDAFDSVAEQADYTLPLGGIHADIESLDEVRLNTASGVTDGLKGAVVRTSFYSFTLPATLTFADASIPAESVTTGIEVDVVLIPKSMDAEVPAVLLARYAEGIRSGVLAEMMSKPKRPWSDPLGAKDNKIIYNRMLNQALSDRERGNKATGWGLST
jgi:hypothetical protein